MTCKEYGAGLVVCTSGSGIIRRQAGCWVCGITDAPIVVAEGSPWYGAILTCTVCGDVWSSEGIAERPFRRGWRQASIAGAVADWEASCDCPLERDDEMYPLPCEHDLARRQERAS